MAYKATAYIHSLNKGKMQPEVTNEITVLEKVGDRSEERRVGKECM